MKLDPRAREAARLWAIEAASDGGIPGDDYIDGILTAYLSTITPAEVGGLVERLRDRAESYRMGGPSSEHTAALLDEAATALEAKVAELAAERAALRLAADRADRAEAPRAEARKALVPDAYEVRCTDGNYEWRRPYHGELEVIMRTGRDRSGKPFEYRALYAAVSPLSTVTPAEVGGQRCDDALASSISLLRVLGRDDEVVHVAIAELEFVRSRLTALEAQAAELAAANHAWRAMKNRAHAAEAALAEARKALEAIERRTTQHPRDNAEDDRRDKALANQIARRAREAQGVE